MNSDLMVLVGNIALTVGMIMIAFMVPMHIASFAKGYGASKSAVFVTIMGVVVALVGFVMRSMPFEKDIQVRSGNTEEIIIEETVASFPEVVEVTEVTEITVPYTSHTQAAEHGTNGGWA